MAKRFKHAGKSYGQRSNKLDFDPDAFFGSFWENPFDWKTNPETR
jgi:hypothetical protein